MTGAEMAIYWRLLGSVLFGLFMFGLMFNGLVDWLGERKEGYVSLMVVGGVLVTLGGIAFISWPAAILGLAAFVACNDTSNVYIVDIGNNTVSKYTKSPWAKVAT